MTDTRRTPTPGAGPGPTGAVPAGTPTGEIGYAEALDELEAILDELDGDEVDVDVLGARVRRAAELLRLCRSRIAGARFEVEQVVSELEAEAEAVALAGGPPPGGVAGSALGDEAGDALEGDDGDDDEELDDQALEDQALDDPMDEG